MTGTSVVAAIDFGTAYSGWAYSLKQTPEEIHTGQWYLGSDLKLDNTPTNVLIASDGESLHSFGIDAQTNYSTYCTEGSEEKYFYFKQFKMCLHETINKQTLDRDIMLNDITGKRQLPAKNVFACGIRYLAENCLETINKSFMKESELGDAFKKEEIDWVLTVPAIWANAAKQFMREAAESAGIPGNCLQIVLEPEAAAVFCRQLPFRVHSGDADTQSISTLAKGSKYMVVDAGGGTIDITVHEIVGDHSVNEVVAASGGGWGGQQINENCIKLIENLCDKDEFETFMEDFEYRSDLEIAIESTKRTFSTDADKPVNLRIPSELGKILLRKNKDLIKEDILHTHGLFLRREKLYIKAEIFHGLFTKAVEKTIHHIKTLMQKKEVETTSAILMVGGFSDCMILQEEIRKSFPEIKIVQPSGSHLCVVKGAVLFGHYPEFVCKRVLKYTYGIKVLTPFKTSDPESRKMMTDKGPMCKGCFNKHAGKGQAVSSRESTFVESYLPAFHNQTSMSFPIYSSTRRNPVYVEDKGCYHIGDLVLKMETVAEDLERVVQVEFMFGGSELQVKASLRNSATSIAASFDFLLDKAAQFTDNTDEETDSSDDETVDLLRNPKQILMLETNHPAVLFINFENPIESAISFVYDGTTRRLSPYIMELNSLSRSILVTHDGARVCAFGKKADMEYACVWKEDLGSTGKLLFQNIFVDLCNFFQTEKRCKSFLIQDVQGRQLDCGVVLTSFIEHVCQHVWTILSPFFTSSEVKVVMTVPTAVTENGKQFIKNALDKANINAGRCQVLLGAEAVKTYLLHEGANLGLKPTDPYLLLETGDYIDCVTVHCESAAGMKIFSARSQRQYIADSFHATLENSFGTKAYLQFRNDFPDDVVQLENDLITKMKDMQSKYKITMIVPNSLRDVRPNHTSLHGVTFMKDKVRIDSSVYLRWYDIAVQSTINLVTKAMTRNITSVLVVGQFSTCPILHEALRTTCPSVRIVMSNSAEGIIYRG